MLRFRLVPASLTIALFAALVAGSACSSSPQASQSSENAPPANAEPQPVATPEPVVRQFTAPKRSSGWAAKDDDQIFEIERNSGCQIRFHVVTYHARPRELAIEVKDNCRFDNGLNRSLAYYGQILDAILLKYSKSRLKALSSLSWRAIRAWDQDLAVAAMESGLWKAFLKKRESNENLKSNSVFVEIFNQGNIARKMAEVFEARGLSIKLKSVEDVREARFKNLSFAHEYAAYSASNVKVPYTAQSFKFEIKLAGE